MFSRIPSSRRVAIRLAAFAAAGGLVSGVAAQPANDLCDNATPVTLPASIAGTTTGSTFDDVGFCGTSNTTAGVWYTFTAPSSGTARASTCNMANYDTKISVFSGTCAAPVCIAGQDDNFGACGLTTQFDFPVTGGTTYRVLVHGFGGSTGNFTLGLEQTSITSFEDNIACARNGINALMQPDITGPAQKSLLNNFLDLAGLYRTSHPSLAQSVLDSVIVRTDGCAARGSPDTIFVSGAAGVDFIHTCPAQNAILACAQGARMQVAAP